MLRNRSDVHVSRAASIALLLLAISLPVQCEEPAAAACAAAWTDSKTTESSSFTFRITPSIFDVDLRLCHSCVRIALRPPALSATCDNVLFSDMQTGIRGKHRSLALTGTYIAQQNPAPTDLPALHQRRVSPSQARRGALQGARDGLSPPRSRVTRTAANAHELRPASCFAGCLESDACLAFTTVQLLSHLAAQLPPGSTVVDIGAAPLSRRVA